VKIVKFAPEVAKAVTDHGSCGLSVVPMVRTEQAFVACLRLTPGGLIGRHEATGRQVLAVVEGDAVVSGADGVEQDVSPGEAAIWEAGETHQTRSANGLTAIVIEGDITTIT
jgi:quercetin dioxygenase-like cupin family protein